MNKRNLSACLIACAVAVSMSMSPKTSTSPEPTLTTIVANQSNDNPSIVQTETTVQVPDTAEIQIANVSIHAATSTKVKRPKGCKNTAKMKYEFGKLITIDVSLGYGNSELVGIYGCTGQSVAHPSNMRFKRIMFMSEAPASYRQFRAATFIKVSIKNYAQTRSHVAKVLVAKNGSWTTLDGLTENCTSGHACTILVSAKADIGTKYGWPLGWFGTMMAPKALTV